MVPVSLIVFGVPGSKYPLRINLRLCRSMWSELDLCIQLFITKIFKKYSSLYLLLHYSLHCDQIESLILFLCHKVPQNVVTKNDKHLFARDSELSRLSRAPLGWLISDSCVVGWPSFVFVPQLKHLSMWSSFSTGLHTF